MTFYSLAAGIPRSARMCAQWFFTLLSLSSITSLYMWYFTPAGKDYDINSFDFDIGFPFSIALSIFLVSSSLSWAVVTILHTSFAGSLMALPSETIACFHTSLSVSAWIGYLGL